MSILQTHCGQAVGTAPGATVAAANVLSEFWAPPTSADSVSDEFTAAIFNTGKWSVQNVSGWGALASAGAVDSNSSPAAGTVRITQQNSRLYIQPALGLEVAVRQSVALVAGQSYQFSARLRMPVPLSVASNAQIFSVLNFAGAGATPDMTNRGEIMWIANAANDMRLIAHVVAGGVSIGPWTGNNVDLAPIDAEFRMLITNQNIKMFVFCGASKHYVLDQNIANFTFPFTGHLMLRFFASNVASSNMPFAPIFDCDYVRRLVSNNVL